MNPFKQKQLDEFTIEDCENYIEHYPYGEHINEVKNRLRTLKKNRAAVSQNNVVEDYSNSCSERGEKYKKEVNDVPLPKTPDKTDSDGENIWETISEYFWKIGAIVFWIGLVLAKCSN